MQLSRVPRSPAPSSPGRRRLAASRMAAPVAAVCLAALSVMSSASAQALPREVRVRLLQAVVQIIPYDPDVGDAVDWSGSGTIISPDGYVLTNFHVIGDVDARTHYEWHAVLMTSPDATDRPPEFSYWARYVAGDPTNDLAVLHIEQYPDESDVEPGKTFPYVEVGDSNGLLPGDALTIVGYPGISGSTITLTAGLMSGWLGEDFETGGKQWIKTDAKIAHGNSGGGAFNAQGHLIGVPTAGRTVKYGDLDVEEQAYVRPIGLAWGVIGPNVPSVARASPATELATVATDAQDAGVGVLSATCVNCVVGTLRLGGAGGGSITATAGGVDYQTYRVRVPEGATSLTIEMSADGDLDLAAKYGSEIQSYADDGDWDYLDVTEATDGTFRIETPHAGVWYVDVFNQVDDTTASYTLKVR